MEYYQDIFQYSLYTIRNNDLIRENSCGIWDVNVNDDSILNEMNSSFVNNQLDNQCIHHL